MSFREDNFARTRIISPSILFFFFFNSLCAQLLTHVQLFATLLTVVCQAPLSVGFFRQGYWSELGCSSPGDLPDPGIKPESAALQVNSLPLTEPPAWKYHTVVKLKII